MLVAGRGISIFLHERPSWLTTVTNAISSFHNLVTLSRYVDKHDWVLTVKDLTDLLPGDRPCAKKGSLRVDIVDVYFDN